MRLNALQHGLLARDVVILDGDGKEDPDEFATLLETLVAASVPERSIEEMLVERIAVCYWRLCRVNRCEMGLLRARLDNYQAMLYAEQDWQRSRLHDTNAEIRRQIQAHQERIRVWEHHKVTLTEMMKAGKRLEDIYGAEENWEYLAGRASDDLEAAGEQIDDLETLGTFTIPCNPHSAGRSRTSGRAFLLPLTTGSRTIERRSNRSRDNSSPMPLRSTWQGSNTLSHHLTKPIKCSATRRPSNANSIGPSRNWNGFNATARATRCHRLSTWRSILVNPKTAKQSHDA